MFKIDQIKRLFDCSLCKRLLVEPVAIPCGNSICKKHLDDQIKNEENKYNCELCHNEHMIPEEGFVINKHIQNGLDIQFNTLELKPVYDECKQEIQETRKHLAEIEALVKDPENFIYEYFADIKLQVDLRREDLKHKIDTYSDEIIQSIENTQLNCIKLSEESKKIEIKIEKAKTELNELIDCFDTFQISDKKFEDIKESVSVLTGRFSCLIDEYKDLLLDLNKYTFGFKEVVIKDVFGSFDKIEKVTQVLYSLFYFDFIYLLFSDKNGFNYNGG